MSYDLPQVQNVIDSNVRPAGSGMAILTDGVHLISTNGLDELHNFARQMGLRPSWFQDHPVHPHYDLTTKRALRRAIAKGALLVTSHELVASYRANALSRERASSDS